MANIFAALAGAGEAGAATGAAAGAAEGAIGAAQGAAAASSASKAAGASKALFGSMTGGSKIPKSGNSNGFDFSGLLSNGRLENFGGPFAQGGALSALGNTQISGPSGNLPRPPTPPSFDVLSLLLGR